MAIVYEHLRNDTNEVFYVGMGEEEGRAYVKDGRNPHWNNIVNKAGYTVNIIYKDIEHKEAKNIEILLIEKYGRKNLGTGNLVNMTDGGEGVLGLILSEDARQKISETHKDKPKSEEHKNKLSEIGKGKIIPEESKKLMSISALNRSEEAVNNINNGRRNRKGTKGYSWHKDHKKWIAYIRNNKKLIYLGYFDIEADAAQAYQKAKLIYHV